MMAEAAAKSPNTVLPEELMIEILSRVDLNNPLQLRCVCKWWKSLVVDPQFVENHLYKSFTDISDLASKAIDHMKSFDSHHVYHQEEEEEEENDDDEDENDDEEENDEEIEKRLRMNKIAQLDNLLVIVRSIKGNLETMKFDMQALKDRMKCLQSFLQIYLKSATASSPSSS
ncbi:hypothetical protein TSUD_140110 [Trifolium subterraneum]|uniref:F-box domain-containing protein n=1 Tax=Trifolium subterraneum TaxID=3900 RepID=A0A2Z6LU83_TRISU|nr:hypothetical protein TSUD_140110 [Trifolium subterraneum]